MAQLLERVFLKVRAGQHMQVVPCSKFCSCAALEHRKTYQCGNKACQYRFQVTVDVERDNVQEVPLVCPNPQPLRSGKQCAGSNFALLDAETVRVDYQELRIQEQVRAVDVGSIPRSMCVVLQNDMVDSVKAGDDVMVGGVVVRRWKRIAKGARCDLETVLKANSINTLSAGTGVSAAGQIPRRVTSDFEDFWAYFKTAPMRGRDVLLRSICPQLCGMYPIKLAVALTLAGGVGYQDESGMSTRGESHLLLVGDPGTGKSQFLRFASKLMPRAILTTGIGSTTAGLTCTAVKDGADWALEAGALVLADRGICCIDEFGTIRQHDRTAIHEAMEQQSISVAKAGMVVKLKTRCSVLAATNPKGRYDWAEDVSVNTAIASPLLSRFDLILVLVDSLSPEWDKTVSSFILKQATAGASAAAGAEPPTTPVEQVEVQLDACDSARTVEGLRVEDTASGCTWSLGRMQAYLAHVRAKFNPTVSKPAQDILSAFYQLQRASESRSAARTTIRLLESLVRLAQAHARLCYRDTVGIHDALQAVCLSDMSGGMQSSMDQGQGQAAQSCFPHDPDEHFAQQARCMLKKLGLSHLQDDIAQQ